MPQQTNPGDYAGGGGGAPNTPHPPPGFNVPNGPYGGGNPQTTPFLCWDGSYSDGPDFCPTPPAGGGGGGSGSGGPTPGNVGTPIPSPSPTPNPGTPVPSNCAPICNVCPENQKRYYMPFVPDAGFTASVTAGSQVRFVGKPQKLFAPDRLIIASSIAPYFDIVQLIIGNTPQSLSQGNVSAEMFSEVATYVMMTFDQAYPGIDVIIVAQNKSSVTQTFQAQLVGEAVG
jgi:hypothetical protein